MDLTTILAIAALALSGLSYWSYLYTHQQLDVTVTDVSYVTNQGGLYMTVAFANSGNRDAALLRVEPALWGRRDKPEAEWMPLTGQIDPGIADTSPKMPTVVKAGEVEMVMSGFDDLEGAPPGDSLQSNKKTPFVWADQRIPQTR
jgi:hypothetical protein